MKQKMKLRRRKFIATVLSLMMVFTMIPATVFGLDGHTHSFDENDVCMCGAHRACTESTPHDGWIGLKQSDFEAGSEYIGGSYNEYFMLDTKVEDGVANYYLTEDITLSKWITTGLTKPNNIVINLCMNGHVIDSTGLTRTFYVQNGATLNVYDCEETPHYFTKSSSDSTFDTYQSSYDPTGKVAGKDYELVEGAVFTGGQSIMSVSADGVLNMYGGTIIGCTGNQSIIYAEDDNANVHATLRGLLIYNNDIDDGTVICARYSNTEVMVKDCIITDNRCKRIALIDNDAGVTFQNVRIENNELADEDEAMAVSIMVYRQDCKVTLKDNVVIKDNLKNGEQRNLSCDSRTTYGTRPVKADNLTSEPGSIGISLDMCELGEGQDAVVCEGNNIDKSNFFSDDAQCYIDDEDGKVCLKHRVYEQPSLENGATYGIKEEGLDSVKYQWYEGQLETTMLNDSNTDNPAEEYDKGTYSNGVWTPHNYYDEICLLFDKELSPGEKFKCDVNFGQKLPVEGLDFGAGHFGSDYEKTYLQRFNNNKEYTFSPKKKATYTFGGCFGTESPEVMPTVKNARIEKITVGDKLIGEKTNKLSVEEPGTYVCKAKLKDKDGVEKEYTSDAVEIKGKSDMETILQVILDSFEITPKASIGSDGKAHLNWNQIAAATEYEVYSVEKDGTRTLLDTVATNSAKVGIHNEYQVRSVMKFKDKTIYGKYSKKVGLTLGGTKIQQLKSKKKKTVIVKFAPIVGAQTYQIMYKLGKKSKVVGASRTTATIKRLKSKKKYLVCVRGVYAAGSVNLVGPWSAAKKVKIK